MLLIVKDANGDPQTVVVQAQQVPASDSGTIQNTGDEETILEANPNRSGWYFQNLGVNNIRIEDTGGDPTGPTALAIPPLGVFPPPGYPVTTSAVNISGFQGDTYAFREW